MTSVHDLVAILFLATLVFNSNAKNRNESFAGDSIAYSHLNNAHIDTSWQKDTTIQGVSFYYKITSCSNEDAVLLAIKNNNNSLVTFSWSDEVWVDGTINAINSNNTFALNSADRKEGSCGGSNLRLLEIKLSDLSNPGNHITGFHFRNINVIQ